MQTWRVGAWLRVCAGAVVLGLIVTTGTSQSASAARRTANDRKVSHKLDRELQRVRREHAEGRVRVIVKPAPGRVDAAIKKHRAHGDGVTSQLSTLNAFAASVDVDDLDALETDPDVASVSLDAVVQSDQTVEALTDAAVAPLLETLGLDPDKDADEVTGKSVGIAVIDSGLERGSDLAGAEHDRQYDFDGGMRHVAPHDDYGHGTHVSGLISGSGKAWEDEERETAADGKVHKFKVREFRGVAPKARIVSLKVLNGAGGGLTSDVIAAIEFAIENREKLKIDIINLSLGHPVYEPQATDPLVQAVEAAVRAGIVVVASAGNVGRNPETGAVGYAGITSPGNAPSAITVGAVDTAGTVSRLDDRVASYSSRGPTWYDGTAKPDVVAPGHRLVAAAALRSSLYAELPGRRIGRGKKLPQYLMLSGTSMAAAVTSGVVALMIDAHRQQFEQPLTPNAIKALLEFSAIPVANADPLTQGAGSVNATGAIALASAADPSAAPGSWWLTAGVEPATTIDGTTLVWGQTVVWGNAVVWGAAAYYNFDAWAQAVVWGTTVVWGNAVVRGSQTDLVWDNPELWASAVVWGSSLLDVGASNDGTVDWDDVGPTTVVWGNLQR